MSASEEIPPLPPTATEVSSGSAVVFAEYVSGGGGDKLDRLMNEMDLPHLPRGLAQSIMDSTNTSVRRFWIVDNSGTMLTPDGHRIVRDHQGNYHHIKCSRWQELGDSLRWHAAVSEILGVDTEFRMLNHNPSLPSQCVLAGPHGSAQVIEGVISSTPGNATPLCAALRQLVSDIQALAPELAAKGQTVSVIIASDGEATDGGNDEVRDILTPLSVLPCDVVIRLCTDDESVVNYWNDIDNNLELELDVLDDTAGEGVEIRRHNPWLGCGEALQRVREFGAAPKVLDFIDERKLSLVEAVEVIVLILGEDATRRFPEHPEIDHHGLYTELKFALQTFDQLTIFDASQKKMVPWIDVNVFKQEYLNLGNDNEHQ